MSKHISEPGTGVQLNPFQIETITLFVRAAAVVSLPRSVAQIYGLLFTTPAPLSLDNISSQLAISRGSTFDGLRWLRELGAVESVFLPGVRKEHFRAEFQLRTLATGFLRNQIQPHVENGTGHIRHLRETIDASSPDAAFQKDRLKQIAGWHKFFSRVLPVIKALAAKPHFPLPRRASRS
jgi:HTH-type transcriptional regulator, glycine betaine synthesis regulator